mmetsp:Transcript_58086/g.166624  ORF Transcript_58086/g.166624 Transcript_58086/m.166624 type:complete len:316 (-) Transcript_58086:27-974(-)
MRLAVQRNHRSMIVHAMIDIRFEHDHQLGRSLIPQREEAQDREFRLRVRIRSIFADQRLEPLVLQEEPNPVDVTVSGLARRDCDALFHVVHNHLQHHERRQLPIVHACELWVHQAQPPGRVLAEHLVEDLTQAACADLDIPFGNRVLDRCQEDVLGILDLCDLGIWVLQLVHRARPLDDAQEHPALLLVAQEDEAQERCSDAGGEQRYPHDRGIALLSHGKWRQLLCPCGTNHPICTRVILFRRFFRNEDRKMKRLNASSDCHVVRTSSSIGHDSRCVSGVQQVHELLTDFESDLWQIEGDVVRGRRRRVVVQYH